MSRFVAALLVALALPAAAAEKPVLSVLYFDNDTGKGDFDVLRKGLADMIITDLVAWDGVSVVEREKLEAVMGELKLQRTRSFDQATVSRLGKFLGAQLILVGSIHAAEPELRLDARVIQAESAKVMVAATVRGPRDKIFDLEQSLVDQLGAGIDLRVTNAGARRRVKAPDLDTLLGYSRAIDLSDQGKVEEAKTAIQQVVSRAPAFLMARDKKEQILKQLEAARRRRTDLAAESTLALAEQSKRALDDGRPFAKLDAGAARERMAWRVVRARLLSRALRKLLSIHGDHPCVVLRGKEAEALQVVNAWLDNQHRLIEEQELHGQIHHETSPSLHLPPEAENQLAEARLGELKSSDPFHELVEFLTSGRLLDGDKTWWLAPAPAWTLPGELKAVTSVFVARLDAAYQAAAGADASKVKRARWEVERLVEQRADMLERLGRDEEAVAEYQRALDAFPSGDRAEQFEKKIRQLLEPGSDASRAGREAWARTMKDGCKDDRDVRKGDSEAMADYITREGARGLSTMATELVRSCQPTPKNRSAIADVFRDLAQQAAHFEDCDAYRAWTQHYLQLGGSVSDMLSLANNLPWCPLGPVTANLTWLDGMEDGMWDRAFHDRAESRLSSDSASLTISGGGPSETLRLNFVTTQDGMFKCAQAIWIRGPNDPATGTCEAQFTRMAVHPGDYDEGTFTAHLKGRWDNGNPRALELGRGRFRVIRR